ncbi:MAG TPA: hypothetical protein VMU42_04215 [Candidatus Sulfotelmatobacter sp.]|nr:hypothetical protein [Candidatus Sulfotelmatobacter sp.]
MRTLPILLAVSFLVLAASGGEVMAQPPPGSNLTFKDWFQSLQQPGTQSSCCSIADCHLTSYRTTANGYEVPINGRWIAVPPDRVLQHVANPTGSGVVCYLVPDDIMCFVRATEG